MQLRADIPKRSSGSNYRKTRSSLVFKTQLSTNSNSEIYSQLGVQTFAQYVEFLSKLIIHIIAFLGTFLIVTIILRCNCIALDIVQNYLCWDSLTGLQAELLDWHVHLSLYGWHLLLSHALYDKHWKRSHVS